MAIFATIVLVTTSCITANGVTDSGPNCSNEWIPETWSSASVVEASQDWQECETLKARYLALPETNSAVCRYQSLMGVAYAD